MKIVVLAPLPPAPDGIADYAAGIAAAYSAQGHQVRVISDQQESPLPKLGVLSLHPGRLLGAARALVRWRPDVLHIQHTIATYATLLPAVWALAWWARQNGIVVLVTHHEVTRDLDRLGLPGRVYYLVTTWLSDYLHVHTEAARERLTERLRVPEQRIIRAPHPVFPLACEGPTGEHLRERHNLTKTTVLLQFGFIHTDKGLLETVRALAELRRRDPALVENVRLVVAGAVRPRPVGFERFEAADRDYLEAVHQGVRDESMGDVVIFTGRVPADEISGWFHTADVVLLPYLATEQSGVANLAISAGAPVLATAQTGLQELFDGFPVIECLDPDPYATILRQWLPKLAELKNQATRHYPSLAAAGDPTRLLEAMKPAHAARSGV